MEQYLYERFECKTRGVTIQSEVRAGMTTFLTVSYILLVNPQVLEIAGVDRTDCVVATALSAGIASIIIGAFGNVPFIASPGLGLSAYLAYGVVLKGGSQQMAFTASFLAGAFTGVLTLLNITDFIIRTVPLSVKLGTVIGMGLLIAFIGMVSIDLVISDPDTVVALGPFTDDIVLAITGLFLIGSLAVHKVSGGIIIGIVLITLIVWTTGLGTADETPSGVFWIPVLKDSVTDFISLSSLTVESIPIILSFVFVAVFDISGVLFGMATLGKLTNPDGTIPGTKVSFLSTSLGTMIGAMFGSTPTIVAVESAAGIKDGGRTGITAIVTGLMFLLAIFMAPILGSIPACANAPVLILVGALMISEAKNENLDWDDMAVAIPAFLTLILMPFTYSITNGVAAGIIAGFVFWVTSGDAWKWYNNADKDEKGYVSIPSADSDFHLTENAPQSC